MSSFQRLSLISLAYPLYSVVAPGQLFPYNLVACVVMAWIIVGFVLYLYYRVNSPEKIAAIGSFIAHDDLPLDDGARTCIYGACSLGLASDRNEENVRAIHNNQGLKMITIEGKKVFTEFTELVDPRIPH